MHICIDVYAAAELFFSRVNVKRQNQGMNKAVKAGFYMANRPDGRDG